MAVQLWEESQYLTGGVGKYFQGFAVKYLSIVFKSPVISKAFQ